MEITTVMTLEVTVIDRCAAEQRLPFLATDENDLNAKIKDMLNADDVTMRKLKQFELDGEGANDGEN